MNLIIKDALWQIIGRVASALGWFLVIKLITPYLGPLRFGDYSTILKFFAIWSAFADFGIYVIALKQLGKIKSHNKQSHEFDLPIAQELSTPEEIWSDLWTQRDSVAQSKTELPSPELVATYGKFVSTRFFMIGVIYTIALIVAYLIPAYSSNPYLIRGLPLWMLFSASFMSAGILQLPLQLYRQMKQLTVGLILARVAQLLVVVVPVFLLFTNVDFVGSSSHAVDAFMWILASVVMSGTVQALYVWRAWNRYLPLKRVRDRSFTKKILGANRQYGVAYYLSSFHTLVVVILISIFYPTSQGYTEVWIWALALGLIEILLIIPSALGNSLIHDVAGATHEQMMKKFGSLLTLILWIGGLITIIFIVFAPHIISFVGGEKFLSTGNIWWSDTILPFLWIILSLSFVKQIFNYIFVSNDLQNNLLKINLIGVIIGVGIGVPLIMKHALIWGLITQGILETMFVIGALLIAFRHRALPIIHWPTLLTIVWGTVAISRIGVVRNPIQPTQVRQWMASCVILTLLLGGVSFKLLKNIMRSMA